jgi:hypothetical protein
MSSAARSGCIFATPSNIAHDNRAMTVCTRPSPRRMAAVTGRSGADLAGAGCSSQNRLCRTLSVTGAESSAAFASSPR